MDLDSGLSAEETAFFESGGESGITEAGDGGADTGASDGAGAAEGAADTGAAAGADKGATKAADHVPLATFLSEKNARKALEKTQSEMAQKLANFEGKFAILDRLNKPAEVEVPKGPPSVEEDIFGNVKHVGETVAQLQKRLDDKEAADKAATEAATAQTTFVNTYKADAAQFEAKNPDYKAAYNHLLQSRASELVSIGYDDPKALQEAGASPAEVQAAAKALHDAIVADEYGIADLALKKGKSPAEIIYGLAKQRGYAKAAPAGDGKSDAEKLLENIEKGQNANKSLNGTGGSTGDAGMTAERLERMDAGEFEAWCTKNPKLAARLMGG